MSRHIISNTTTHYSNAKLQRKQQLPSQIPQLSADIRSNFLSEQINHIEEKILRPHADMVDIVN